MANLSKLTSRDAFLEAMTEFDQLGREAFLQRHGYQHANSVFVKHEGKLYDQRAIIGVAYGKQYPDEGPLDPKTFCGGLRTGRKLLVPLGFEVRQSGNSLGTITGAPILQVRVAGTQPGQSVKPATKRHATGGGRLANSSANAENCRRNGQIFEALAKLALQKAGFAEVRNLNEIRQNFPGF